MTSGPSRLEKISKLRKKDGPVYRIDMSYVGTSFHGFQSQPGNNTIQDAVEKALKMILGHDLRIRGASRTDSGVHAQHQVAVFRTHKPYSPRWLMSLNALTPESIGIMSISSVDDRFDPIFDSTGKAYRYRLWRGKCFNPFLKPYVWDLPYDLDHKLIESLGQEFIGEHDFSAFCNKDSDAKSTVRTVLELSVENHGPLIDIWITGKGFLKQMVRIMTGTLVEASLNQKGPDYIRQLLAGEVKRQHSGSTAPPQGLCLVKVFYDPVSDIKSLQRLASSGYCQEILDDHKITLAGKK